MRCLYSFFNSTGEGKCLTGTKLGDVGWRCLQSLDGNRGERQRDIWRERERQREGGGGELKSIRNSETLWIC